MKRARRVNSAQSASYMRGSINEDSFMPASQATVPTASASRYLQQLCKHWSHKFAVEFTPEHGTIPFDETRVPARCLGG